MTPPPAPESNRSSAVRALFWVGLTLALPTLAVVAIALGATSYFRLSSDTQALRNGLMEASGVDWRRQICVNIGGLTFGAVRAGLSFVPLEPEARAAVRAVRGAEVGIYSLSSETNLPDNAAMLAIADRVLSARGWERVVGVMDDEKLVGVYLPAKTISARRVKTCVMVFDGQRMILVSARANVEQLWECLEDKINLSDKMRSLAAR